MIIRNITEAKSLAVKLMLWHGGMSSALYSVASSLKALRTNGITRDLIDLAKCELWNKDTEETDMLAESLETFYISCL